MTEHPISIVEYQGKEFIYRWVPDTDVAHLQPFTLISCVCFNDQGQVLVSCQKNIWRLPGGQPNSSDAGPDTTISRELAEETNVIPKSLHLLGGFEITPHNQIAGPFFQLVYYAEVDQIHKRAPDPEEGTVSEYIFAPIGQINSLIAWKETGHAMLETALRQRRLLHPDAHP